MWKTARLGNAVENGCSQHETISQYVEELWSVNKKSRIKNDRLRLISGDTA